MDTELEIIPPSNPRHKVFADLFLEGKSATQAAIDAGYSERTANTQAAQIRSKPEVSAYIRAMQAKSSREASYEAERWQRELITLSHSNIADFSRVNNDGELEIDFSSATREQLAAVQSVKVKKRVLRNRDGETIGEEKQTEVKLWDKVRSLELLGKHSGFLRDTETRVVIDVADRLMSARGRVMKRIASDGYGEESAEVEDAEFSVVEDRGEGEG